MQLQNNLQKFDDAGLSIALVTYDSPELQQVFIDKYNIEFPVLSDLNAATVNALEILNEEHTPGAPHYGIPHPGIFILDTDMTIRAKIFVEAYAERVDADGVLLAAKQALGI